MSDGSVQSLSCVRLFVTPWTAARQASLSFTNSQSLLKLMSIESVMPSNHLILCRPLLLLPSIFPSIRVVLVVKNLTASAGDTRDEGLIPGSGRSPRGGQGNPLQYSCLENPHGQRSLAGYSPQGCMESDRTEVTQQSCILETNIM